jgi:hypothetical protein
MTHGSLFSGIGGFDLAAEWMGWENKFHCEWNEFGQKVLHHYWPEAELFTDITKSDFTKYANRIDILTGGFPCQPYSSAGKRLGKEDDRHLWPQMLRTIREIQPRWVVGENVRGLTNWNGGLVFDEVQADLEAEGYQVLPFLLPACAVNAPTEEIGSGLLPTPKVVEAPSASWENRKLDSKYKPGVTLTDLKIWVLLPTPRTSDERMHWKTENWKGDDLGSQINEMLGIRSHLSPQFVMEMMGFPTDWTLLPFLNGETNQSKLEEMQ